MTGPNGTNGSGRRDNVESLEEARRRAAEKKKQEARTAQGPVERTTLRDWIIGGIILALAGAAVWQWLAPAFRAATGT